MNKKFEIELPKEILDAFIQIALAGLCFFSSLKLIQQTNPENKTSVLNLVVYAIAICFLAGIYYCIDAAIKTLKRYYSKVPLEIVFYDDRLEVPSDAKIFFFFPDHQDKVIIYGAIKKIYLRGSLDEGKCWVKILYLDHSKLKKARISNSVFKSSAMFKDFVEQLREIHPF